MPTETDRASPDEADREEGLANVEFSPLDFVDFLRALRRIERDATLLLTGSPATPARVNAEGHRRRDASTSRNRSRRLDDDLDAPVVGATFRRGVVRNRPL